MKGLKRSLLYWGYIMEKYFLIILFTTIVMGIMMGITSGRKGLELEIISTYIPMIGTSAIMIQAISNANYHISQALSFGASRKECMIGLQIFTHVTVLQIMLIALVAAKYLANPTELETAELLQIYTVLFVFGCGAGNGVCATTMRFGNKPGLFVYIVSVLFSIFFAIAVVMSDFAKMRSVLLAYSGWGIIAAVIFDVIMIFCSVKAIQKYEVRV